MERITDKHLQRQIDLINKTLNRPIEPWSRDETTGRSKANVGNFHLSGAYGGVALEETVNESGGVNSVFNCGHVTKRDLYDRMRAYLAGIETAQKQATK